MAKIDTKVLMTELGEQLEQSETRCEFLKSQLGYMKFLYQGVPTEQINSQKSENYSDVSLPHSEIIKKQYSPTSEDFKEFLIQEDYHIKGFRNEVQKMHHLIEETIAEIPKTNRERIEEVDSEHHREDQEENKKSDTESISSPTIILTSRNKENVSCRDQDGIEVLKISFDRDSDHQICRSARSPIVKSSRKHFEEISISSDKQEEEVLETLENENREIHNETEKKLALNLSRSLEDSQENRRKKSSKSDKRGRTVGNKSLLSGRVDESIMTVTKVKRKKGKLKSSNSKSTIATRDTNFSERKSSRKRKQKGFTQRSLNSNQNSQQSHIARAQESLNDVVELYHNLAVKSGSLSVVSSRHSRLNSQLQDSLHVTSSKSCKRPESRQQNIKNSETEKLSNLDVLPENLSGMEKQNTEEILEKQNREENFLEEKKGTKYLQSYHGSRFCDPFVIRNYEQPTVASSLKRVQGSYFNRFNFRNIPFVIGTSITPSHNLALNIQQVLSIMKSKQARPSGIAPLLIRKVSQGVKPMTSLFTDMRISNDLKNLDNNQASQISSARRISNLYQNSCSTQQTFSKNTCETLFEEKGESDWDNENANHLSKQNSTMSKISKTKKLETQPEFSQSSLIKQKQTEKKVGDNCLPSYQAVSNNSKGIKEVLIKLHNQLEEMNAKYEKLQEKAEKTKDKSLARELEKLEVELTAKEEEIKAVVGLYVEVLDLKKQMKMLTERNSFVCISTESSNPCPIINHGHTPIIRAYTSPQLQMNRGRGIGSASIREPSTSTRLTGLLRQLQTLQRQLKHSS